MKRNIILFVITLMSVCFIAGCQKSSNGRLNQSDDKQRESVSMNTELKQEDEKKESKESLVSENGKRETDDSSEESLEENRIIQTQSFDIELNDWGKVKFISYEPDTSIDFEDVSFLLIKDDKIVYSFPYYCENNRTDNYAGLYDSVAAVGFEDVNNDNHKDVIVIINYITGAGPQGLMPRPRARIFLADKKGFYLATDLIDDITNAIEEKDLTIDNICKYLKNK